MSPSESCSQCRVSRLWCKHTSQIPAHSAGSDTDTEYKQTKLCSACYLSFLEAILPLILWICRHRRAHRQTAAWTLTHPFLEGCVSLWINKSRASRSLLSSVSKANFSDAITISRAEFSCFLSSLLLELLFLRSDRWHCLTSTGTENAASGFSFRSCKGTVGFITVCGLNHAEG